MSRMLSLAIAAVLAVAVLGADSAVAGDVNINVGWPPPVIVEKPRVILVPETKVYRAPNVEFNVFMYGGKYYSLHNDRWFVALKVGAPWTHVLVDHVPVEVRAVPVKYYKVPPGHMKKAKFKPGDDDDHGRGKGCPPGLAKQGRC